MKINRRQFLTGIAGLGAAVILPENATASQINAAWTRLLADPWYFDVAEYGTLVDPTVPDPETRADVWGSIRTTWMKTPSDLIHEVGCCEPLAERFRWLASDELDDISRQLGDADDEYERARLERLMELLSDEVDGWKDLVQDAGTDGLRRFLVAVEEWLNEPVDWDEQECFPRDFGGQGKALAFFEDMAADVAEELGIVIIEGDQPGSTHFGAELRNSIEDANETAERMGLPFRFRAEAS